MKRYLRFMIFLFLHTILPHADAQDRRAGATCESLAGLPLPDTTITLTQTVAAGALDIHPKYFPASLPGTPPLKELPAFCRVAADIRPTKDSDIKIEVWMPLSGWNGKFQSVGNGALSGAIWYPFLAENLSRGYATAGTDTGHEGKPSDITWVVGHPEKVVDSGYRAIHEMTVKAKAIIQAFYGNEPRHSYWSSCSTGGRQGLMEAQRFPGDYDGIIAGAPGNFVTHKLASDIWIEQALFSIPEEKVRMIHKAVLKACDTLDGVEDGMIEDPTRCHVDPSQLQCKQSDGANCLTTAEVEAARRIYAGPQNPRTGDQIFPGLEPGSEPGWVQYRATPDSEPLGAIYFKLVLGNPNWDFRTMNFDTDVAFADKRDGAIVNAVDPNLKPFVSRGGKLILFHGWSDPSAPLNTINYYNSVVSELGRATVRDSVRLFMIPGQYHCGDGRWLFDVLGALDNWSEHGKAPDRIVASRYGNPEGQLVRSIPFQLSTWSSVLGKVDRTRPLCPYPQIAKYTGHGSTDEAANFVCTEASR